MLSASRYVEFDRRKPFTTHGVFYCLSSLSSRALRHWIFFIYYRILLDYALLNCGLKLFFTIWSHHVKSIFAADLKISSTAFTGSFLSVLPLGISVMRCTSCKIEVSQNLSKEISIFSCSDINYCGSYISWLCMGKSEDIWRRKNWTK